MTGDGVPVPPPPPPVVVPPPPEEVDPDVLLYKLRRFGPPQYSEEFPAHVMSQSVRGVGADP